jgi:pimeloyl-ACP methyl ester carboxylesterase
MKTFLRVAMLAALVVLLAPSPAPAAAPGLHRCDLGLQRPFRCGRIEVPIRRVEPALGMTKVGFALRPRGDRSRPSLGTIVAIDGGPGYASTSAPFARSLIAVLAPLLRRHDLILFDARGTGRSEVVNCPALQRGLVQEQSRSASAPINSGRAMPVTRPAKPRPT